jgi:hypothetical protein
VNVSALVDEHQSRDQIIGNGHGPHVAPKHRMSHARPIGGMNVLGVHGSIREFLYHMRRFSSAKLGGKHSF